MIADFNSVVKNYSSLVYSVAYSRLLSKTDAEDVFQDVFLTLYRKNKDFKDDEHLKAWLINVTLKLTKKALSKRAKALDNESGLDDESITFNTTEQGQVFEAITRLPQKQKICIELYYIQGYSSDEISKILSMKPSAVRMNLKRAREALREILGKEYFDE